MYKDEQHLPESILQRQVTHGQEEPLHVTEENSIKNDIEIKEAKDNEGKLFEWNYYEVQTCQKVI